jgi:predicted phosphodiesterase
MILVHVGDTHLHNKNPVSRTDEFNEEVFLALGQTARIARHVKADAIVHAGDWFHKASRVPWPPLVRLLMWAADLKRDGIPILTVPGNHDLEHDRYDSMSGLPIGALFESGLFRNISYQSHGGVFGVPWPLAGQPVGEWPTIPSSVQVVVAHCFATPEGGLRWGQHCHQYEVLAAFAPQVRIWHFGHDHTDHGIYTASNGARMINIGAAARGVLDYDTLTRQVKVAVSRLNGDAPKAEVQQIALKLRPVAEVFDLALREKKQREAAEIEAFVSQLQGNLGQLLNVDYLQLLDGLGLETAVRQMVDGFIQRAEDTLTT